jgi:hypothetical protein
VTGVDAAGDGGKGAAHGMASRVAVPRTAFAREVNAHDSMFVGWRISVGGRGEVLERGAGRYCVVYNKQALPTALVSWCRTCSGRNDSAST